MSYIELTIKLGIIPVAVLAALILLMYHFGYYGPVFNPPYLLLILNVIFISLTNLIVAVLSAKSYLKQGLMSTLLLGCGLIISAIVSFIAGWTVNLSANFAVTVYNIGMLIFAGLQLQSGFLSGNPAKSSGSKWLLFGSYGISILFVIIISTIAWLGYIPIFFSETGFTFIRQLILGAAIVFLAIGSLFFLRNYLRNKFESSYWYALALSLFALGLLGVTLVPQVGDYLGWISRAAQYAGGIYFLISVLRLKQYSEFQMGLSEIWAETFRADYRQFENLFSKMLDGFAYHKIHVDENGKPIDYSFIEVNSSFEKMTGLKRSEIIGKKVTEILPGIQDDPADWIGVYGRVALTGEPVEFENYSSILNKWYSVSAFSPKKGYFVAIFEDVTDQKKAEEGLIKSEETARQRAEELEKLQLKLEERAAEIEEYATRMEELAEERAIKLRDSERLAAIGATAGMVGHDIRNPLQSITSDVYLATSDLELLPESEQRNSALESLEEIEKNVDYINKIVQDLQDFARPLNPVLKKIDLEELFEDLLRFVPENISVTLDVKRGALDLVTDPALLKRILSNLFNNAVQAMPDGGELKIKTSKSRKNIVISVEDTGNGIPEEAKPRLFTPLFTTKSKGQGFGLAVVKRMTEAMNGSVDFESEAGKGTKFLIKLPNKNEN